MANKELKYFNAINNGFTFKDLVGLTIVQIY